MKAIRVNSFGGPEVLQLQDRPDLSPTSSEVLVAVRAAGVNPVDTYIRSGNYGNRAVPPYTPGFDAAGTITAASDETIAKYPHLSVGSRVYTYGSVTGCYAGQLLARPDQVWPLPDSLSFEQGACLGVVYLTAYQALFAKANLRLGERVLVHGGSGGVGQAAIQFAVNCGCDVVATASTLAGQQLCRQSGATAVLNHADPGYLDVLRGGPGFDVIVENLANVNLNNDLTLLAPRGRITIVGNRGTINTDPRLAMSRDASIHGMALFNATPDELRKGHTAIAAGISRGFLRPTVHKTFPLADAAKAHQEIMTAPAAGKLILVTQ